VLPELGIFGNFESGLDLFRALEFQIGCSDSFGVEKDGLGI
jgi:hypothetical protein